MKKLSLTTFALLIACGLPQVRLTAAEEKSSLSEKDMMFIKKAAAGGMFEVEAGECAQKMGASDDVKMMGEHMAKDHTAANTELMGIAKAKGVEVPTKPMKAEREELAMLKKTNGAAFDREYSSMMVKDHNKDIAEFEKEGGMTKDADLKGFIDKTLPVLKTHLEMAQKAAGMAK